MTPSSPHTGRPHVVDVVNLMTSPIQSEAGSTGTQDEATRRFLPSQAGLPRPRRPRPAARARPPTSGSKTNLYDTKRGQGEARGAKPSNGQPTRSSRVSSSHSQRPRIRRARGTRQRSRSHSRSRHSRKGRSSPRDQRRRQADRLGLFRPTSRPYGENRSHTRLGTPATTGRGRRNSPWHKRPAHRSTQREPRRSSSTRHNRYCREDNPSRTSNRQRSPTSVTNHQDRKRQNPVAPKHSIYPREEERPAGPIVIFQKPILPAPWKGKAPTNPGKSTITHLASTALPITDTPRRHGKTLPRRSRLISALIGPQPRLQPPPTPSRQLRPRPPTTKGTLDAPKAKVLASQTAASRADRQAPSVQIIEGIRMLPKTARPS